MSIACLNHATLSLAQQQFETALPQMDRVFRFHFRRWPRRQREEALAEARAAAWTAWHGLVRRDQNPLTVGVTGIAFNAVRNVKQGRRVGNPTRGGSGAMDIQSHRAQRRCRLRIYSLDSNPEQLTEGQMESWREMIVSGKGYTPADEAAFRLDFEAWLSCLVPRRRRMAKLLGDGHTTNTVARRLGVSPACVSQTRRELCASWRAFQAQALTI